MLKYFILFLLLESCILLLPATRQVYAQSACPPLFGGGQICEEHPDLSIDKQVQDPQTKKFIDSLTAVSNFLPDDQALIFRITIKNTSNKALSNILLEDTLPTTLIYKSGDGKFDSRTHKISDTIEKLDKGQSQIYTINTSVNQDRLNSSSACSINHALITQNNKKGSDYVKVCINTSQSSQNSRSNQQSVAGQNTTKGGNPTTKGGLPVFDNSKPLSKTPDTGPEAVGLISLPFLAGVGYFLRKQN